MIKKYYVQPLKGLQVGDLIKMKNPHAQINSGRTGDLGIIVSIGTETNSSFDYDQQKIINHDFNVYEIYWQVDKVGYGPTSILTEKYLKLVWSNEKQDELASQIGLYDCENDMAGSIGFKYQERK
jgi:hypothetical protein